MFDINLLKKITIRELTNKSHIQLENVFLYVYEDTVGFNILFDENNIYTTSFEGLCGNNNYCEKKIDLTQYISLENTHCMLMFNDAFIPCHNYEQFIHSFNYIKDNKDSILFYETNNKLYNQFINFIANHINNVPTNKIIKISPYKLYKINKVIIPNLYYNKENGKILYSDVLENIIPKNNNKNKYYNIKLINQHNLTNNRSFINCNEISKILYDNNYLEVNNRSEYEKQICIQNSKYLILSWGGNHLINCYFSLFNKKKRILILCHKSYYSEYIHLGFYELRNSENIYESKGYSGNYIRFVFDIDDTLEGLDTIIKSFENYNYNNIDIQK
jgi:hypothetical protein